MIVSNITCMKTEYIRLKHAKWVVWSENHFPKHKIKQLQRNESDVFLPLFDENKASL
ncbi:hypothetical protein LDENG_00223110 [Lucifuga dentata]|nr:hypothetical protein LDENG_00223110 [Lucifuga dentata]